MSISDSPEGTALDRRATALDEIRQMHDDLNEARETIRAFKKDLEREEDRRALLIADRERYLAEATLYRTKLVELSTSVANIGLLTLAAQDIMRSVHELLDPPRVDAPSTLHAVANAIEGHIHDVETPHDETGARTGESGAS